MISESRVIQYIEENRYTTKCNLLSYEKNISETVKLRMIIEYDSRRTHEIKLVLEDDREVWYVIPYKYSHFRINAYNRDMFDILLLAIKEHDD